MRNALPCTALIAREYPDGFGEGLHAFMGHWKPQPRLRQKELIDLSLSDKEVFQSLPLGDLWEDARLVEVYRYMRKYKCYKVPVCWQHVLEDLDAELDRVCPLSQSSSSSDQNASETTGWYFFWYFLIFLGKKNARKSAQIPRKSTQISAKVHKSGFLHCCILGYFPNSPLMDYQSKDLGKLQKRSCSDFVGFGCH